MLYIFHVDSGHMLTFDMNLALENVHNLKETIERIHGIKATSQVLLVSGGEMLQPTARVCSYSAGTDTNPIYMFSTTICELKNPPPPWPSIDSDTDLKLQVDRCLELPATYNTVVARAHLAQKMLDMGREENKICERLVHEQHLQQQGWAAVVANMEDITEEFRERCDNFHRVFNSHTERREEYLNFLSNFNDDLEKLSKIPILAPLIQNAESKPFHGFDDAFADNESFKSEKSDESSSNSGGGSSGGTEQSKRLSRETTPNNPTQNSDELDKDRTSLNLTLLQWISATENQKSMKKMSENCLNGLKSFDKKAMENLQAEIQTTIEAAQREDMKEIKGLGDRLYGLEQLMCEAKKNVQEQSDLATSFQQNQSRAANLGDTSILPDLCASHRNQLLVMLKNHKHLRDIRRRCARAKDELGTNLYQRLQFIIQIENKMCNIDSRLLFYHGCLRRLQKHLDIIEQIHQAPQIYVTAVNEVVRRKMFSSAFLMWASNLACHLLNIYNDEVMKRQEFTSIFDGHFLSALFPGIEDMPPPFATEPPSIFDSSLPNLTQNNLKELSMYLPDLTSKVQLPDIGAVIDFFSISRSGSCRSQEKISLSGDKSGHVEINITRQIDIHSHLKDFEKGFDSETDTEEFEKVSQSPIEKRSTTALPSTNNIIRPETCSIGTSTDAIEKISIETLTEDNLGTTRLEVERLKSLLKLMQQLSLDSLTLLKQQLKQLKTQSKNDRIVFAQEIQKLSKAYENIASESKNREREVIQQMTVDHELEMNDLKKSINMKDEEIQSLTKEKSAMQVSHLDDIVRHENEKEVLQKQLEEMSAKVKEIEQKLVNVNSDKEKAVANMKDKITHEFKTELESLRCRYKLMTSMERSPSDTSLEKIERPDMIDIANHESILSQVRENFAREKELAVKNAIEQERVRLEEIRGVSLIRNDIFLSSSPKSSVSSQDIFKRIIDEKDKQLETLRERENVLTKEIYRHRETIQTLTDNENQISQVTALKNRLDIAQKDKKRLEQEMEAYLSKNHNDNVTINSCVADDVVIVVWNSTHRSYSVIQDSRAIYFLHPDSYQNLNLANPKSETLPDTIYCLGKVISRDYCQAKKDENRYGISKGIRFYRVKVRPLSPKRSESDKCSHKKSKIESLATSTTSTVAVSRSTSTDKSGQQQPGLLIDSFAQTDCLDPLFEDVVASRDVTDSGISEQHQRSTYRERNISIVEEDDLNLTHGYRIKYESVCEDDKSAQTDNDMMLMNEEANETLTIDSYQTTTASYRDEDSSLEYRSLENKDDDIDEMNYIIS